ncbi:MAG: cobyric acid synthase [Chloroflexota bacterium]
MTAKTLMVVGTSSSAGKSLLVTALCHYYARRGVKVAPYKAQNMSNNAAVCANGSEIGRAQAVQALAAGIAPRVEMNPVLIKPEADSRSQVVVMGRPWQNLSAREYYPRKKFLWEQATGALDALRAEYDLVIMEGAGSPVELNLKEGDIVNMAVARYADAPTLLVGDIDRGGIFAQLLGTLWLLPPEERTLVRGLVVNKFRGDISLFADGVRMLEERGGAPVLGVLPYLRGLFIPEEDAVALEVPAQAARPAQVVDVAVIRLPRIANFDDFDPLAAEPGVRLRYVDSPAQLGQPDAVILPGTKSTVDDLAWLRAQGLAEAIRAFVEQGGAVVGICGGYQMLGKVIYDPQHVESRQTETSGLGLLPIETTFAGEKATYQASAVIQARPGWFAGLAGQDIHGYEIHMGRTTSESHWLEIALRNGQRAQTPDGAVSADGRVWGCYVHGLFANQNLRRAWLESLGWQSAYNISANDLFAASLARLADSLDESLNMQALERIIWDA